MEIKIGNVLLVTQERNRGDSEIILRAGDLHYRYTGTSDEDRDLTDQQFQFIDGWHNASNAFDVNHDSHVTANDALMVINERARRGKSGLPVDRALRQIHVTQDMPTPIMMDGLPQLTH